MRSPGARDCPWSGRIQASRDICIVHIVWHWLLYIWGSHGSEAQSAMGRLGGRWTAGAIQSSVLRREALSRRRVGRTVRGPV